MGLPEDLVMHILTRRTNEPQHLLLPSTGITV